MKDGKESEDYLPFIQAEPHCLFKTITPTLKSVENYGNSLYNNAKIQNIYYMYNIILNFQHMKYSTGNGEVYGEYGSSEDHVVEGNQRLFFILPSCILWRSWWDDFECPAVHWHSFYIPFIWKISNCFAICFLAPATIFYSNGAINFISLVFLLSCLAYL